MNKIWTKFSGLVVFSLLLAAYPATEAAAQPWKDAVPLRHVIQVGGDSAWPKPLRADEVLANADLLRKALEAYGAVKPNGDSCSDETNLGTLISCIKTAHSGGGSVPELAGFGGVNALAFLDAAKMTLNPSGDHGADRKVVITLLGRIEDYLFLKDPDPTVVAGTGILWANTTITRTLTINGAVTAEISVAYRWQVRVVNNGFRVVQRSNADPEDPFPETMTFEQDTLDRINDPDIPLNYKLWVRGKKIIIELVQKRNSQNNWVTMKNKGANAKFYQRTDENCIDMMFQDEPPQTLGNLAPPLYCLGRCGDPTEAGSLVLVNTGW